MQPVAVFNPDPTYSFNKMMHYFGWGEGREAGDYREGGLVVMFKYLIHV